MQKGINIVMIQALANILKMCLLSIRKKQRLLTHCACREMIRTLDSIAFLYTAIIVTRWRQGYEDAGRAGKGRAFVAEGREFRRHCCSYREERNKSIKTEIESGRK